MSQPRAELENLPDHMLQLLIDERGYAIPRFVACIPGSEGRLIPEFRAADTAKWHRAIRRHRCWVCGGPLGVF